MCFAVLWRNGTRNKRFGQTSELYLSPAVVEEQKAYGTDGAKEDVLRRWKTVRARGRKTRRVLGGTATLFTVER